MLIIEKLKILSIENNNSGYFRCKITESLNKNLFIRVTTQNLQDSFTIFLDFFNVLFTEYTKRHLLMLYIANCHNLIRV